MASILQKPSVNAGSQLRADTTFNGFDRTCMLLPSSTLAPGKVDTLNYKTIRYPGHAKLMKFLLYELILKGCSIILHRLLGNGATVYHVVC